MLRKHGGTVIDARQTRRDRAASESRIRFGTQFAAGLPPVKKMGLDPPAVNPIGGRKAQRLFHRRHGQPSLLHVPHGPRVRRSRAPRKVCPFTRIV